MFTISKEFSFAASHQLKGLPEDHPCSRLHGHNYKVILTLDDKRLNPVGFVRDYRELDFVKTWIDERIDHRNLNDVFDFNPTAENMAFYFYNQLKYKIPQLKFVTIMETEKTSATYEPARN